MTPKARTIIIAILLLLAVGIGAAYLVVRLTPHTPDSSPPETTSPVETGNSPDPEPGETASDPTSPPGEESATKWSTPLVPICGEVIAPSDLDSTLRFTAPPPRLSAEDPFPVTVANAGEDAVVTELDRYDFAVPVLTDESGVVVAAGPLEPILAEGYSVLAIAAGDERAASGTLRWTESCDEKASSEHESPSIAEGEYQMFLFATTGPFDNPEAANQIQGGPFPVTVDTTASHEPDLPTITGSNALPECGQEWPSQIDAPGTLTLTDGAGQAAMNSGQVEGTLLLPEPVSGAGLYAEVVILADDQIIGPQPLASDNLIGWYASPEVAAGISGAFDPTTCDGESLPVGEYEGVLTVRTIDSEESTIAVSEPFGFSVPE